MQQCCKKATITSESENSETHRLSEIAPRRRGGLARDADQANPALNAREADAGHSACPQEPESSEMLDNRRMRGVLLDQQCSYARCDHWRLFANAMPFAGIHHGDELLDEDGTLPPPSSATSASPSWPACGNSINGSLRPTLRAAPFDPAP